jgi:hypothetical protein
LGGTGPTRLSGGSVSKGTADVKEAPVPAMRHDTNDQRLLLPSGTLTGIELARRNADRFSVREPTSVAPEPMIEVITEIRTGG